MKCWLGHIVSKRIRTLAIVTMLVICTVAVSCSADDPSSAPTAYSTPSSIPTAACTVEESPHSSPQFGVGFEPLCVVWPDRFSDESGFLVRLTYLRSGDVFEHTVPANETSYTWPPAEQPNLEDPDSCADRGTIQVDVFAMIGDALTPIDGMSANAECRIAK
jgi:hypothetical protein